MPQEKDLNIFATWSAGMIMGLIAYMGSFSLVPILSTITSLLFGKLSLITIFTAAFSLLFAGYLHTHSSRTGISVSTNCVGGFFIAKSEMKNRRQAHEKRSEVLFRFFIIHPINAWVLNVMWQTFTFYYIMQTILFLNYVDRLTTNMIENERKINGTVNMLIHNDLERHFIIINGITRCLAGCLAGMSTGMINHLWQRYQKRSKASYATFNTDKKALKLLWKDRKKLLSPYNVENWIKAFVMLIGASFVILSHIPNITGWHLMNLRKKRLISDILVINGGWFYLRDAAMLVLKKQEKEKSPETPSTTVEIPLVIVNEAKPIDDDQSATLTSEA